MPDLTNELDDLINSFAEADRPAARDLYTRNQAAASLAASQSTVYKAFVDGDPARMAAATAAAVPAAVAPPVAAAPPAAVAPPAPVGVTLDQLTTLLNERLASTYTSPAFLTAVEARAKEIADQQITASRPALIGQGAEIADQLYSIRSSHSREFSEELDSAKFKEFFVANGAKFANSLTDAYDSFVGEKRVEARIKRGVEEGLAARETSAVPGSSLPGQSNPSPLSRFVDFNTQITKPAATPTADVDKAAQAFSQMHGGWAN